MSEPSRQWAGLVNIEVVSGTAQDGAAEFRGFVTVRAIAEDGSMMTGQLDPDELRAMALNFLSAAEAADQDALVFRVLTKRGIAADMAAVMVRDMRDERPVNADNGTSVKSLTPEQRLDIAAVRGQLRLVDEELDRGNISGAAYRLGIALKLARVRERLDSEGL